jgi:hypothetical protein
MLKRAMGSASEGAVTVEWILLVGGIVVPMAVFLFVLMDALLKVYSFTSWSVSLPFP